MGASNDGWFVWSISSIWLVGPEILPEEPDRPANQTDEPVRVARAVEDQSAFIPFSVPGARDRHGCHPISFTDSLSSEQRQIFYERHRLFAILMILVVLLFSFAGLYVTGLFGAVLGLLLSLAAF
ncbi:MAG: hypothetical protein A2V62_11950 [Nitrospirae bacterium RBG_19FT_COMBO_58_9]|nr:MAG: hypothetical protein A2V62_11950 [Nitrospirae bacterium RBG_19FT_COMBO_58_9]